MDRALFDVEAQENPGLSQIQFAAITQQFAVVSPTIYFEFVTIFRWAVIGFGLPWLCRAYNYH